MPKQQPVFRLTLSVKSGEKFIRSKTGTGAWKSDGANNGPSHRATVNGDTLKEWAKFFSQAAAKDVPISISIWDAKDSKRRSSGEDNGEDKAPAASDEFSL